MRSAGEVVGRVEYPAYSTMLGTGQMLRKWPILQETLLAPLPEKESLSSDSHLPSLLFQASHRP